MGEIRFVGTGETRGYPYLVCKKNVFRMKTLVYLKCRYLYSRLSLSRFRLSRTTAYLEKKI